MFSLLGFTCEELGPTIKENADMICAAIPNNNYTIPCPDVTEMPDLEMTIDAICTRGGDNDQDGHEDFMFITYQDGDIYSRERYRLPYHAR